MSWLRDHATKPHDSNVLQFGWWTRTESHTLKTIALAESEPLMVVGGSNGMVELWRTGVRSSRSDSPGAEPIGKPRAVLDSDGVKVGPRFGGHGESVVRAVALSRDARYFVTTDGHQVLLWPGPSEWAKLVCGKLRANMTPANWDTWVSREVPYEDQCDFAQETTEGSHARKTSP